MLHTVIVWLPTCWAQDKCRTQKQRNPSVSRAHWCIALGSQAWESWHLVGGFIDVNIYDTVARGTSPATVIQDVWILEVLPKEEDCIWCIHNIHTLASECSKTMIGMIFIAMSLKQFPVTCRSREYRSNDDTLIRRRESRRRLCPEPVADRNLDIL